jgi:CheY-like chemotaxis protein
VDRGLALPRGNEQLLVVDDDRDSRRALGKLLRRLGYRVVEAPDGESALASARSLEHLDLLDDGPGHARAQRVLPDQAIPGGAGALPVCCIFRAECRKRWSGPRHPAPWSAIFTSRCGAAELADAVREILDAPIPRPVKSPGGASLSGLRIVPHRPAESADGVVVNPEVPTKSPPPDPGRTSRRGVDIVIRRHVARASGDADLHLAGRYLAPRAAEISWWMEAGPADSLLPPARGPYDLRMGYTELEARVDMATARGFSVVEQARSSERLHSLVSEHGLFPVYREKDQGRAHHRGPRRRIPVPAQHARTGPGTVRGDPADRVADPALHREPDGAGPGAPRSGTRPWNGGG